MTTALLYLLAGHATVALLPFLFRARYRDVWTDAKMDPAMSLVVALLILALWPGFLVLGLLIAVLTHLTRKEPAR